MEIKMRASDARRQRNKEIAAETMRIAKTGNYHVSGKKCSLGYTWEELETVELVPPDRILEVNTENKGELCSFSVVNMDSFEANRKLALHDRTLVMNFASARHPGGGFLSGASAQEETLCRNSTLYVSIGSTRAKAMYDYNESCEDPFYSDYMLLSPKVCVFRNEIGNFMSQPFHTAVITVPAVNWNRLPRDTARSQVSAAMENRILRMLRVAVLRDYETLVLGAWGCGVFRHDARDVAQYFKTALVDKEYGRYFKNVIFAVYDKTREQNTFHAFVETYKDCK